MAKKVKGLRVSKDLQEKFKFKGDGTSILGDSTESSHEIKGTGSVTGSIEVEGVTTLKERISGYTFSPPHIDASSELQIVQELIDNAAAMYEGFLVYITNAAAGEPFVQSNKFYFCEDGTWHPSPFSSEIVNYAPELNPTYEISVAAEGTDSSPFSLNLPSDLFIDQDGDTMTYTATLTNGSPLPAWLSFDATNTILSGTPTESDIGLLHVLITATDPSSESGSTTQEIQILAKPVPYWQNVSVEGYENASYTHEDIIYTTGPTNNDLVIDPQYNGDYLITTQDDVDLTAGPIVIDFEFDSALTDGMGIRWGDSTGGTYSTTDFCFGLVAPGGGTKKIWLGAAFTQNKEGTNGVYAEDDSSLDVRPLEIQTTDGNAYPLPSNNWQLKETSYHRDAPEKPWLSPADRMVQVPDIDFRIIIDGYRKSPTSTNDMIDVTVIAMHKTLPQSVISAGHNLTLDDLLDGTTYGSIPVMYQNCVFHRTVQSVPLYGTSNPTGDFQPFAYFNGGNHTQSPYSPNHAAVAPKITSWTQVNYLPPICNYPNSVTQLLYTGATTQETLQSDFIETQNDYSRSTSYSTWGTEIQYSAELQDGSPLPSWVSFDAASRTFTFSPQSSDIGMYSIKITGTDGSGMSVENTRTYEVQQGTNSNPPPPEPLEVNFNVSANSSQFNWTWNTSKFNFHDNSSSGETYMRIEAQVQDTNGSYVTVFGSKRASQTGYDTYNALDFAESWTGNAPSNANDLKYPQMFGNTPEWGDADSGRLVKLTFYSMLHDVENGVNVNYTTAATSPLVYYWDVYAGTVTN